MGILYTKRPEGNNFGGDDNLPEMRRKRRDRLFRDM